MSELKVKIETTLKDDKFQGNLFFTSGEKNITVRYVFKSNPKKSLERGDELDLTFYFGETEHPVRGIYPQVLANVSQKALYAWSLSRKEIYENIFFVNANISDENPCPMQYSQEISGTVSEEVILSLFG